jgi:hypothetical protein
MYDLTHVVSTTHVQAPELFKIKRSSPTEKVDQYSFGVLLWEVGYMSLVPQCHSSQPDHALAPHGLFEHSVGHTFFSNLADLTCCQRRSCMPKMHCCCPAVLQCMAGRLPWMEELGEQEGEPSMSLQVCSAGTAAQLSAACCQPHSQGSTDVSHHAPCDPPSEPCWYHHVVFAYINARPTATACTCMIAAPMLPEAHAS